MVDYYADNDLIINKLGIFDPQKLKKAEERIVTEKTAKILTIDTPKSFDFKYLLYIHKELFSDIYDFAGQIRTVDITKPDSNTPFAYAKFIQPESQRIFSDLERKNYLTNMEKGVFINEIIKLSADLNALHPFRDGNGRTIRLFLILLTDNAGYLIDYSQVSSKELINADILAFNGDINPLLNVYTKIVL